MKSSIAVTFLRWVVAVVSFVGAAKLFLMLGHHGVMNLPANVLRGVALAEMAAAILFVIPKSMKVGGVCLLIVYSVALVVHLLHGQYDVLNVVVLAAAVWVILEK